MKLLTDSEKIEKEFERLMKEYSEFYWLSAWAGVDFKCFNLLKNNKQKIKKVVIGTHFDQTHPDFIKEFIRTKNVKFRKTDYGGMFHPKLYLFKNSNAKWEMLVGSMNFTCAGFSQNTEILILISKEDGNAHIYDDAIKIITESWARTKYFSEKDLAEYRIRWKNQQRRSGKYGNNKQGKPVTHVKIMNLSWQEFIKEVKKEECEKDRLKVLQEANFFFKRYKHFNLIPDKERRGIAGYGSFTKKDILWAFFGTMQNMGKFTHKIKENNKYISLALDQIPRKGVVKEEHYHSFLKYFKKAFPDAKKDWLATSTRLLAMKRPDIFLCFDSRNKTKLCKAFGIKSTNMTYDRYWKEIIERIFDCKWWNAKKPQNKTDSKIWEGRSAFLDALYYKE